MIPTPQTSGIVAGRLPPERLAENFSDLSPPLSDHEALVAADRCYFCYDAPCVAACPTKIDIPLFVRQIGTGVAEAAARTILSQNILGGMCARVCPTETLCEEACVREAAEGKPVEIGRLQRFATDVAMARGGQPFQRAASTGRSVAVVGAGPAGLSCAHRLALLGHAVTLYDARSKGGGLNEFGIAAYKAAGGFAQAELDWLLGIGGIAVIYGERLGAGLSLGTLCESHDAVFLGIGLGGVNALAAKGTHRDGVRPAVDFIAEIRQSGDLARLPVGRRVVVIGGGMTAIDAAVQSKLLGAEEVTILYRRGREKMSASHYEQDLATTHGVRMLCGVIPMNIKGNGAVRAVECAYVEEGPAGLRETGETFTLDADQVLTAIGQTLGSDVPEELELAGGKIRVTGPGQTSVRHVWAGGDCASGGDDLTVTAVAEGRDAAMDIHRALAG